MFGSGDKRRDKFVDEKRKAREERHVGTALASACAASICMPSDTISPPAYRAQQKAAAAQLEKHNASAVILQAAARGFIARRTYARLLRAAFDKATAGDVTSPENLMSAISRLLTCYSDDPSFGDTARLLRAARLVMPATGDRKPLETYASLALHRGRQMPSLGEASLRTACCNAREAR